uniref:Uncharacterized protein n=1 Tax=Mycena chlorophos TaxID=658473 RepID=A0ABQ0KUV7_MYCCL|nr:predicted protein [Mycena chlorophos]
MDLLNFFYEWPEAIELDNNEVIDRLPSKLRRRYFVSTGSTYAVKIFLTGRMIARASADNMAGDIIILGPPKPALLREQYCRGVKFLQNAITTTLPKPEDHVFDFFHCTPLTDESAYFLRVRVPVLEPSIRLEINHVTGIDHATENDPCLEPGALLRCSMFFMREEVVVTGTSCQMSWPLQARQICRCYNGNPAPKRSRRPGGTRNAAAIPATIASQTEKSAPEPEAATTSKESARDNIWDESQVASEDWEYMYGNPDVESDGSGDVVEVNGAATNATTEGDAEVETKPSTTAT